MLIPALTRTPTCNRKGSRSTATIEGGISKPLAVQPPEIRPRRVTLVPKILFETLPPALHGRSVRSALEEAAGREQGILSATPECQHEVVHRDVVRSLPKVAETDADDVAEWNRSLLRAEQVRILDKDTTPLGVDNDRLSDRRDP
jgi:hypothetical protein